VRKGSPLLSLGLVPMLINCCAIKKLLQVFIAGVQ